MSKIQKRELKLNKLMSLIYSSSALFVFLVIISMVNISMANATETLQQPLEVTVQVIGTCNVSVNSGEEPNSEALISQCNDNNLGFTTTDKLDIQSETISDTSGTTTGTGTSTATKDGKEDSVNTGKKQVELTVGQEENLKANVKVRTVLFFG